MQTLTPETNEDGRVRLRSDVSTLTTTGPDDSISAEVLAVHAAVVQRGWQGDASEAADNLVAALDVRIRLRDADESYWTPLEDVAREYGYDVDTRE